MLRIEGFIAVNLLLFMVLFSFVLQTIGMRVTVIFAVLIDKYFKAKKEFLLEVSKLDVPSGLSSKYN